MHRGQHTGESPNAQELLCLTRSTGEGGGGGGGRRVPEEEELPEVQLLLEDVACEQEQTCHINLALST